MLTHDGGNADGECTPGEFQTITRGSLQYYGDPKAHSKLVIGSMCMCVCVCVRARASVRVQVCVLWKLYQQLIVFF